MRLATWNINGLRARIDYLTLWLNERQPDIVGLQETKIQDADFPEQTFNDLGYHVLRHGQKSWNGVAVLSKEPAELVQAGLPGQEDFGARLLSVKYGEVAFTTAYCPNGKNLEHDDYTRKLGWYGDLKKYWSSHRAEHKNTILCGDFNICPDALDSWHGEKGDGSIFHTDAERKAFAALTDEDLQDLFRVHYPDANDFSWWDYRGGSFPRNHGLRIDFVMASSSLIAPCKDAVIDRDFRKKKDGLTASDHAPVYVDIEL